MVFRVGFVLQILGMSLCVARMRVVFFLGVLVHIHRWSAWGPWVQRGSDPRWFSRRYCRVCGKEKIGQM